VRTIGDLVVQYGGPVSNGLLDPHCHTFRSTRVEGVVGYRNSWGAIVALGDPVCGIQDMPRLAAKFRRHCAARRRHMVYAAGSERLAGIVCRWGGAAVEFGETLIFDPRLDPQSGAPGHELRKKVRRATREGAVVDEYRPERTGHDPALESALEAVAAQWLRARHGLQIYVSRVRLFEPFVAGRRWFYARAGESVVGVLALLRLESRGGYLLEHLFAAPESPIGITELLVTECFATLAREGCPFATFGPAPAPQLGSVQNLGSVSEAFARRVFATASHMFHLYGRTQYQHKFQAARAEPAYLVFDPPRVGLRDALGVMRAFNVSIQ
jgi:aspartyl-tRNA synthetase